MHNTIKLFQKRLTNLSTRNRALLLLRLVKSQFLDLHDLDYLQNQPSFSLVESLMARKNKIPLCQYMDSRDKNLNKVSAQLLKIHRADQMIFEERGARDLYVGYPFVHGKLMDDTTIRAPLLFFPVALERNNNQWEMVLRQDEPVSFNKTLMLAFSHFHHLSFTDDFLDQTFEDFPKDSREFRTQLYQLLEESPLEINFNQQSFEDRLIAFTDFTKADFGNLTETGKLKVYPEAVIGIFPQSGSYLMPDYEALLQKEHLLDIEDFFVSAKELINDPDVHKTVVSKASNEEELLAPYPMDASQEKAIRSVKSGSSLVIQGPPGSGKSQLICNLIADHIARGKNVLLVCQKKAALDVVYNRLKEKELDDFAALVHDFKHDRKNIYEKIDRQIDRIEQFQHQNNSLDAIYLERNFLKASREIDQIIEELTEFKQALFDLRDAGLTPKDLYLSSDLKLPGLKLRREYEHFTFQQYPAFLRKLKTYVSYALRLDVLSHPWAKRKRFDQFTLEDLQEMREIIATVAPFFEEVQQKVSAIIHMSVSLEECEWLLEKEPELRKMLEILEDPTVFKYFKNSLKHQNTDHLWLANMKKNLLNAFGMEGLEVTLDKKELGSFQIKLDNALQASNHWYSRLKWKLLSEEANHVVSLVRQNGLEGQPDALEVLTRRLDNRMNFEHNRTKLSGYPWLIEMPDNFDANSYSEWLETHIKALQAKKIYANLRNGVKYLDVEHAAFDELYKQIDSLLMAIHQIPEKKQAWLKYLTETQINNLLTGEISTEAYLNTLNRDFDDLCDFDKLWYSMQPYEQVVITKLKDNLGYWHEKETISLFENSIRINWINHIETKYPVLRNASSKKIGELETTLQQAIDEKIDYCQQIVLLKARERTFKNVAYNRLNNMITYRDLRHQVNKKRSIWPLRKLLQNFSYEVLDLLPCWMASPESVSAIFPVEEVFDLVIFDEASQCFAEKGIPAMYRGKQVVITGDHQQLAPYDLYQPRWEEDSDEDPALEIDSLLDLGARYLSQIQLTGHYRSRTPDLIGFSNEHFYAGKLRLMPQYEDFLLNEPAIKYLKVAGVWEKNANLIEAQKVVQLIKELTSKGMFNIGVITFNFRQQELIRDLLENDDIHIPEELFVKNIENVQGDERDVIIFSVGYAPSPGGKMYMQFGSLSLEKGENRLNVAITRARKKVYVVSSIKPEQLKVDDTKNRGPKLLQQYLHYAWNVSEGRFAFSQQNAPNFPAGLYLKDQLRHILVANGYKPEPQSLPFADLLLKHGQKHVLLLTDDDIYYESLSAKEAHAYSPMLLRQKGWVFERYYSRNLWKDSALFEESLLKFISNNLTQE